MRTHISKQARTLRRWLLNESRSEIRGFQQLDWLLRDLTAPVAMTNMAIQPSTLVWIINDIRINRRQCIVELGSGVSTQLIAACLRKLEGTDIPNPRFYSVEEDLDWINYLRGTLQLDGLDRYVTFVHAPRREGPGTSGWYDIRRLDDFLRTEIPDLLIVDGPSVLAPVQRTDRDGALPYFLPKMGQECTIFIDDAERPAERKLLERWSRELATPYETMNAYLGVITRGRHYVSRPF